MVAYSPAAIVAQAASPVSISVCAPYRRLSPEGYGASNFQCTFLRRCRRVCLEIRLPRQCLRSPPVVNTVQSKPENSADRLRLHSLDATCPHPKGIVRIVFLHGFDLAVTHAVQQRNVHDRVALIWAEDSIKIFSASSGAWRGAR
jgi:hypothetical protein